MEDFYVAKSYEGWERIGEPTINEKGKLSIQVRNKCSKCGGTGVIASRVENGKIVPISRDAGVCYTCEGTGYETKLVRLYTSREHAAMERANEKRKQEKEKKRVAEAVASKQTWIENHGFSEEGTYILQSDTYSIKDELKAARWKYDTVLGWHKANPAGYEDRAIFVPINEVIYFTAWGKGEYKEGAEKYIADLLHKDEEVENNFVYVEKDTFSGFTATLVKKTSYMGRFGLSYVYTFHTDDYCLVWFTNKEISLVEGEQVTISGRVKDRKEYKGIKQTIVNYCKLK